jgi:hypothetical protein
VFWHGCNYPWSTDGRTVYYGLDFGDNVWGSHLGVSTRRTQIERDFARLAALGCTVVRWFLFGDGRAGIVYDSRGLPIGCDAHLFGDVDAALEIAGRVGIGIAFVLLDHHWMFDGIPDVVADPTTGQLLDAPLSGGRAHVLISPRGHDALMAHVFEPLVTRYGRSGKRADLGRHLFAVELMNEPDFVVKEWPRHLHRRVSQPVWRTRRADRAPQHARACNDGRPLHDRMRTARSRAGVERPAVRSRLRAGAFLSRHTAETTRSRRLWH